MPDPRRPRPSIFGGLLLIVIGVVFLLHYHAPDLLPWSRIWRYWPLLLIFWGLAKLYDHFSAQRHAERPPRLLSGGEFVLLIIVVGVGAAFTGLEWAHRNNPDMNIDIDIFAQPYTFDSELPVQPAKPDSTIAVIVPRGNISIHPGDAPELRVVVSKVVRSSSKSEAERLAAKPEVTIENVSGGYRIRGEIPEGSGNAQLNLEVHVPKQASISAKTDRGDVRIADLSGAVSASLGSGDIEIRNINGDVTADTRHGDTRITGVHGDTRLTGTGGEVELADVTGGASINGEFYGPIRARNITKTIHFVSKRTELTVGALPGHLEMDSDKLVLSDTPSNVTLNTRNKDVEIDNVGGRLQITDHHGDIQARFAQPPHDEVNIFDESGSIDLTLPGSSSWIITAFSHSGDIQSDFQAPTLKLTQESDNARFEGKLGARGPQITLNTSYGTIRIHKAGKQEE